MDFRAVPNEFFASDWKIGIPVVLTEYIHLPSAVGIFPTPFVVFMRHFMQVNNKCQLRIKFLSGFYGGHAVERMHNIKIYFFRPLFKHKVLSKVLEAKDIDRRYCFRMHIPLREIFRNNSNFSTDEAMYLNNANTHVDFLIYEKFGKTPCFGIEVDGYNFHRSGTRQAGRDQLKNSIFAKNNISLLRLTTNDSNEYDKIARFIFAER